MCDFDEEAGVDERDYEWVMGRWYRHDDICSACGGRGDAPEGWECEECDGTGLRPGAEGLDPDDPCWHFEE